MFAMLGSVAAFLPIVVLMFKGEEIRHKLGVPKNISQLEVTEERQVAVDKLEEEIHE